MTPRRSAVALMLVAVLVLLPTAASQEEPLYQGNLSAVMVEKETGEPLEWVTVTLYHTYHNTTYSSTSDVNGSVSLTVPWGECVMSLSYNGTPIPQAFAEYYPTNNVGPNNTVQIDINLTLILQVFFTPEFTRDSDLDGSPNWWEEANGRDPYDDSDGVEGDDDDTTDDDDVSPTDDDDDDGTTDGEDEDDGGAGASFMVAVFAVIFVILLALAAMGYSKIRRERVLDHSTRQSIYDHIREHPGVHMRGIKSELNLPMGVLNHHLYRLETEEMIKSQMDGQYKKYYPIGYKPDSAPHLNKTQKAILKVIADNPGKTPGDYSQITGKPLKTVYYHVETLEKQGLISTRKEGKQKLCFPLQDT